MIVPDDKDWTWVLERPCPECRFDASTARHEDVASLVRQNAADWRTLQRAGAVRPGRPDEATWSTLEYACHVRDVYRRYHGRMELMLVEDDPLFPNWDQDASAIEEGYDAQDPTTVVGDLEGAAETLAAGLERIADHQWDLRGRRSDGASFSIGTIARYMIHDPIHHLWDVSASRGR
jgi:hypothetical protein